MDARLAICIATYRRPRGLGRLLRALQGLDLPPDAPPVELVIVDNDASGSARAVCDEAAGWLRFPLHYRREPRRGIPQARNAALRLALGRTELAAFIDDDALPSRRWLAALLAALQKAGADAATGPCHPRFERPPADWAREGGFFARPEHPDGSERPVALTGNALVRCAALAEMPELFDERLALCGGSDVEFFQRFARAGHRIVWAADALVEECVPASRVRVSWVLRRALRVGGSTTYAERKRAPGPGSALHALAHGAWCVGKGAGLLLCAPLRPRAASVEALRLAVFGAGRLLGLAGFRLQEYARVHGG